MQHYALRRCRVTSFGWACRHALFASPRMLRFPHERPACVGDLDILKNFACASNDSELAIANMFSDKEQGKDPIRRFVANRRLSITTNRPDWGPFRISIGIDVLFMLGARDINISELAHCIYLAQGASSSGRTTARNTFITTGRSSSTMG